MPVFLLLLAAFALRTVNAEVKILLESLLLLRLDNFVVFIIRGVAVDDATLIESAKAGVIIVPVVSFLLLIVAVDAVDDAAGDMIDTVATFFFKYELLVDDFFFLNCICRTLFFMTISGKKK